MTTKAETRPLVFLADDDITIRMIARECLEASGFRVAEAHNGREAVERIAELRPDVVILDVIMPEMDGYDACRHIRARPENKHLPILMMTAQDDTHSVHNAYAAGASEYTTKPINWIVETYRLINMIQASKATQQVDISRQEWERTFNALDELVIVYDADMTIIQSNHAATAAANSPRKTILGETCSSVFCNHNGTCTDCPIKNAIACNEKITQEWPSPCFNGTYLLSVFPMSNAENRVTQAVCLAKDISEQKRVEQELRCAQKMDAIGTLAGGLAHDFNNLLQIITGYAELGCKALSPDEELWKYLKYIRDAAHRGGDIARQLMTVGRKAESRPVPLSLNATIQEMVSLLERTFPKLISIQLDLADDLSWVNVDVAQMEQVIMNLAVNAKHALPDGGSLRFQTRNVALDDAFCRTHPYLTAGHYVLLSVSDNGCGMDKETQRRIFEPFFTTRTSSGGSGLGLAMAYGIIRKHHGQMVCHSKPGTGTAMQVYLPAHDGTTAAGQTDSIDAQSSTGGDELILLVDDDPDIINIAKKMLLRAGYRVLSASNGKEALETIDLTEEDIDLMILDLNMPIMGGLECLNRLRQNNAILPVLIASGMALNGAESKQQHERVDYLSKPYGANELLQKIRRMLNHYAVTNSCR